MRLALALMAFASPAAALSENDCEQIIRLNERYWLSEKALSLVSDACGDASTEACRRAAIANDQISELPPVNGLAVALLIGRECAD